MKASHTLLNVFTAIVTIQLTLLPVSHALKVQINSDVKLREHIDSSMERVGLLKKGTIVEIPDDYTVLKNGKPDLELTLNNWLATGGSQRAADGAGSYNFDGEAVGLFFPVRVTKPAQGSTVRPGHQQTNHFVALEHLVRSGDAFIVSDDTEVYEAPAHPEPDQRAAEPVAVDQQDPATRMEAQSACSNGLCSQPSDASAPVRSLIEMAAPGLAAAAKRSGQIFKRTQNDLRHVYSNFEKSCGFGIHQFLPIVKSRASQAGVPAEILLSIMTQESSGRCYVLNSETDKTQSVGLFQINSASSNFPRCTSQQKNVLKSLGSANRLATGPRCLENPIVNLDESIRLLATMQNSLVSKNGFDLDKVSHEDLWRMTVSSYNGGSKWVLRAKKDLETFNIRNGTSLSPYKWEDLRIFYMREWLNRDQKAEAFGNAYLGRSRQNAVANLSYTENIVGRRATASTRPGLTTAWLPTVKD